MWELKDLSWSKIRKDFLISHSGAECRGNAVGTLEKWQKKKKNEPVSHLHLLGLSGREAGVSVRLFIVRKYQKFSDSAPPYPLCWRQHRRLFHSEVMAEMHQTDRDQAIRRSELNLQWNRYNRRNIFQSQNHVCRSYKMIPIWSLAIFHGELLQVCDMRYRAAEWQRAQKKSQ